MFGWIRNFVRGVRIDMDYVQFERDARAEHLKEAARRYDTSALEQKVRTLMADAEDEVGRVHLPTILGLEQQLRVLDARRTEAEERLELYRPHYKRELDQLFDELRELSDEKRELHIRKCEAYDALESAKSDIDGWYSKSQGTVFGNAGKKLPNHSIFGQSHGDLDGYKSDRDAAWGEVSDCKERIAEVREQREAIGAEISRLKADRARMYELKKQGRTAEVLWREVEAIERERAGVAQGLADAKRAKDAFLKEARSSTGAADVETEIDRAWAERQRFETQFDSTRVAAERKALHRARWLAARGLAG